MRPHAKQRRKRGITRSYVIERDSKTLIRVVPHDALETLAVEHCSAFRQFENDSRRRDAMFLEHVPSETRTEPRIIDDPWINVQEKRSRCARLGKRLDPDLSKTMIERDESSLRMCDLDELRRSVHAMRQRIDSSRTDATENFTTDDFSRAEIHDGLKSDVQMIAREQIIEPRSRFDDSTGSGRDRAGDFQTLRPRALIDRLHFFANSSGRHNTEAATRDAIPMILFL
jgi:hypothetical protein